MPVHVNPVTNWRAVQTKGVTLQLAPLLDSPRLAEQDVCCGRSSHPAGGRFLICGTWNHAAFMRSFWGDNAWKTLTQEIFLVKNGECRNSRVDVELWMV